MSYDQHIRVNIDVQHPSGKGQDTVIHFSYLDGTLGYLSLWSYLAPYKFQNSVYLIYSLKEKTEHNGKKYFLDSIKRFQKPGKIMSFSRRLIFKV